MEYKLTSTEHFTLTKNSSSTNIDDILGNIGKVSQTATTTSANYEILFSGTADNTTRTEGARKSSELLFNPSSNFLTIGTDQQSTYTITSAGNINIVSNGDDARVYVQDHYRTEVSNPLLTTDTQYSGFSDLETNKEEVVIFENTTGSNKQVTFTNTSNDLTFKFSANMSGGSFTIPAAGIGEVSAIRLGNTVYIRGSL